MTIFNVLASLFTGAVNILKAIELSTVGISAWDILVGSFFLIIVFKCLAGWLGSASLAEVTLPKPHFKERTSVAPTDTYRWWR